MVRTKKQIEKQIPRWHSLTVENSGQRTIMAKQNGQDIRLVSKTNPNWHSLTEEYLLGQPRLEQGFMPSSNSLQA